MAFKNKLGHYAHYASVASLRFSANEGNTSYTIGPEGAEQFVGMPDIPFDKFIIIADEKVYWTHGKAYRFYSLDDIRTSLNLAIGDSRDYINRRFNSIATLNGKSLISGGDIDINTLLHLTYDDALDIKSDRPLKNKAVTEAINDLTDKTDETYERVMDAVNAIRQIISDGISEGEKTNVVYMSESQWRTLTRNETVFSGAAFEKLRGCEISIYEDSEDERPVPSGDDTLDVVGSVSGDVLTLVGSVSGDTLIVGGTQITPPTDFGDTLDVQGNVSGGMIYLQGTVNDGVLTIKL